MSKQRGSGKLDASDSLVSGWMVLYILLIPVLFGVAVYLSPR